MNGISLMEILNSTAQVDRGTTSNTGSNNFSVVFGSMNGFDLKAENQIQAAKPDKSRVEKSIEKMDIPDSEKESLLSEYNEISSPEDAEKFLNKVKETAEEYGTAAGDVVKEIANALVKQFKLSGLNPEQLMEVFEEAGVELGETEELPSEIAEMFSENSEDGEIVFKLVKSESPNASGKDIYQAVSLRTVTDPVTGQKYQVYQELQVKDSKSILKMADMIALTKNQGNNKLTVQLYPKALGKVNIELIENNGKITAKIICDKDHARMLMVNAAEQIKQNLSDKGIVIDSMDFLFADLNQKDQTNGQNGFGKKGKKGGGAGAAADEDMDVVQNSGLYA